jgi:hypothetical protein
MCDVCKCASATVCVFVCLVSVLSLSVCKTQYLCSMMVSLTVQALQWVFVYVLCTSVCM